MFRPNLATLCFRGLKYLLDDSDFFALTYEVWEIEAFNNLTNTAAGQITIVPTHDFLSALNKFSLGKIRYSTIRAEAGAFVADTYTVLHDTNVGAGENWNTANKSYYGYKTVVNDDVNPYTRNFGGLGAYALIYRVGDTIGWVEIIVVNGAGPAPIPPFFGG